jgi:tetratricopeptide (TPR) repeat protein
MDSLLQRWLSASVASTRTLRARRYRIIYAILAAVILMGHPTSVIADTKTQATETSLTTEQKIDAAKQAAAEAEEVHGTGHIKTAQPFFDLAKLYRDKKNFEEARRLYERVLAIKERVYKPDNIEVSGTLFGLARAYIGLDRLDEAETLYLRALAIDEKALGPEHPHVAATLFNLASLYDNQARYAEAEPLYLRALAVNEKALGPEHPHVAATLFNLASLYDNQARYAEAEQSILMWLQRFLTLPLSTTIKHVMRKRSLCI